VSSSSSSSSSTVVVVVAVVVVASSCLKMLLMFLNSAGSWNSYNIVQPGDIGLPVGLKANMGREVAAVDDTDGDGVQDVAVSSIGEDEATSPFPEGAVHVVALFRSGNVKDWRTFNGSSFGVAPGGSSGGPSQLSGIGSVRKRKAAVAAVAAAVWWKRRQWRTSTTCLWGAPTT
jgi:hypothetical protein